MFTQFEFYVGILAILGFIWVMTSFGKFIINVVEFIEDKLTLNK